MKKKSSKDVSEKKKNSIWGKIGVICLTIFIIYGFSLSCSNMGKDPVSTIQWDIRKVNASAWGYSTRYAIGEVESVSCNVQENDGNGRYILKCSVTYYPKNGFGATLTTSKMTETIYAIFMRNTQDNFSRLYTSSITSNFKTQHCWGKDKSRGLFCS